MAADTSLLALSAVELRRLIAAQQVSPVELLEACIARIEAVNPFVNAVTATCFERARDEARAAERAVRDGRPLGLLHGLPMGVKDLVYVIGQHGLLTAFDGLTGEAVWKITFTATGFARWRCSAR